jgi:predicted signal transduction protein with EAL and GGDEF domain
MGRFSTDTLRLSSTQKAGIGAESGTFATSQTAKSRRNGSNTWPTTMLLRDCPIGVFYRIDLSKAVAGARRRKEKLALLFLDLDRFKDINDSLGHSVGDLLLQEVANDLRHGRANRTPWPG